MRAPSSAPLMLTLNCEIVVPAGMLTSAWKYVKFRLLQQPGRIEPTPIPIVVAFGQSGSVGAYGLDRSGDAGPQFAQPAAFCAGIPGTAPYSPWYPWM